MTAFTPARLDPAEATLTVDLGALASNYRLLASMAGAAETAPVVKADGYGLGVGPVARRLWDAGARSFFVARIVEGEVLRRALGRARAAVIYVLDGCPAGSAGRLVRSDLTPVLNSLLQIEDFAAHARAQAGHLDCAIHIDTGLNRLGLRLEEARALVLAKDRMRGIEVGLIVSHLACSSEPHSPMNRQQAELFTQACTLFPGARRSLSSSAGVFLDAAYHLDQVRPGVSLFGGGPFGRTDARLKPVVRLDAPILQVRQVPPGESIGYGAAFRAERPMRIAVIGAGYADGVLRAASPGGYGWLDKRCGIVGRISMDLIALDVTDCEAALPGAFMELIGPNVALDDAAHAAGTIAYEILTRLSPRLPRRYLGAES
jgi:alanine racemase